MNPIITTLAVSYGTIFVAQNVLYYSIYYSALGIKNGIVSIGSYIGSYTDMLLQNTSPVTNGLLYFYTT